MAQKVHADDRAKFVLQWGALGITNSERPQAQSGTAYTGYVSPNAEWMIQKDVFTGTLRTFTYASNKNNAGVAYAAAWTNRATITYGAYNEVFEH